MRKTRFLLLSLSVALGPAAAVLTACSSDEAAPAGGETADAAPDVTHVDPPLTDAGSDAPPRGPAAKASAVSRYLGQTVELDGSSSTGSGTLTYAWTVSSAPAGSTIATGSLVNAATAKTSFVPDKVGTYTLSLTVSVGTATSSATVTATVIDPPVFYFHTERDASANDNFASLNVVGAGEGSGGTPVTCFRSDAGAFDVLVQNSARMGSDWWEAPAGQPSKVVFGFEKHAADGGVSTVLLSTTSTATCPSTPTQIDEVPGFSDSSPHPLEQPRVSPSGSRVVYARATPDGAARITTAGLDGSAVRSVGAYGGTVDGGQNPDAGMPISAVGARPVWLNDTTIAWLQAVTGGWQIVSASDQTNAPATLLLQCAGNVPYQFDVLPNGEVIVAQYMGSDKDAVVQLQAYAADMTTKACGEPRNISQLTSTTGGSKAFDFALSPDKVSVAYLSFDDTAATPEARVARVDGSTPPHAVGSVANGVRGPRWVGGGSFLSWGVNASEFGGNGTAIAVSAADGGNARAAASAPDGQNTYAIGTGFWSCGFAPAVGSSMSLLGIAGIFGLRLARRRRRSSERTE